MSKRNRELRKSKAGKSEKGDCTSCTLSALCLPIGPARLALMFWKCQDCDCFYIEHIGRARGQKRTVQVNRECAALMDHFSKLVTKNLWRCYHCREKERQRDERAKAHRW